MMRLIVIAVLATMTISGCESDNERLAKEMEKQIDQTIHKDWEDGIPIAGLTDAYKMCVQERGLRSCDVVGNQLIDLATAFASCKADQRSKLCGILVQEIKEAPIAAILSKVEVEALPLPDNPWYWSLPTTTLESQASHLAYRKEVAGWWWQKWGNILMTFAVSIFMLVAAWMGFGHWDGKRKQRAARHAALRAEQKKQRMLQEEQAKQEQLERIQRAEFERLEAIEEQQRIAEMQRTQRQAADAEKLVQRLAAKAAEQLAAEQAEARKLLDSVFLPNHANSKQRNKCQSSSTTDQGISICIPSEGIKHG